MVRLVILLTVVASVAMVAHAQFIAVAPVPLPYATQPRQTNQRPDLVMTPNGWLAVDYASPQTTQQQSPNYPPYPQGNFAQGPVVGQI